MVVGMLEAWLRLRESRSLKDKRQVLRSIQDRLRNQFPVAISEVDDHDDVQSIVLGIAAVGHEIGAVKGMLQKIQEALRAHPVAEYVRSELNVGREVV
jgi:uncharacterized protein YlxP (DUF503 family)